MLVNRACILYNIRGWDRHLYAPDLFSRVITVIKPDADYHSGEWRLAFQGNFEL